MFRKKGQAALEFLTTYGWAFLVILVMIGALSYFGVLDPSRYAPNSCKLSGSIECAGAYSITNTTASEVSIRILNNNAQKIDVVGLTIAEKSNTTNIKTSDNINSGLSINPFGEGDIIFNFTNGNAFFDGFVGKKKVFNIAVQYKLGDSGIINSASGAITTTVQG